MNKNIQPEVIPRRRKGRWVIGLLVAAIVLGVSCTWQVLDYSVRHNLNFQPPEMAAVQFAKEDAIGDLGGVHVKVPQAYAGYLEYDGDPGFGPRPKGPRPVRTQESKIASFGFDAPFPLMNAASEWERLQDKRNWPRRASPWIYVGVAAGDRYPGAYYLARTFQDVLSRPTFYSNTRIFRTNESFEELRLYTVKGEDPETGRPFRDDHNAEDIYVHWDISQNVDALISCTNTPDGWGLCNHRFDMHPKIDAAITLQYERGQLGKWRAIQEAAKAKIEEFRLNPSTTATERRNATETERVQTQ